MVYDAPLLKAKFKKRLDTIAKKFSENPCKWVKLHKHTVCKS